MDAQKLGRLIASRREALGISPESLSSRLNVTETLISRWEQGEELPSSQLIAPLAQALEISVGELIQGEQNDVPLESTSQSPETPREESGRWVNPLLIGYLAMYFISTMPALSQFASILTALEKIAFLLAVLGILAASRKEVSHGMD